MKYSWKGHRQTQTQEQNKQEWASSVGLRQRHQPQYPNPVKVIQRGPVREMRSNGMIAWDNCMSLSFIFHRLVSAFQEGLNPSYLGIHYNFFFFFYHLHFQWYSMMIETNSLFCQKGNGRLHLNTHTPFTQRSRNGLTYMLCRHKVGTYQGNDLSKLAMEHPAVVISGR